MAVSAYILTGVAFVQFVGLVIFKVFLILKRSEKMMKCLRKEQHVEDDWELNKQAAVQKEMESDTEEQDSNTSENFESLATY